MIVGWATVVQFDDGSEEDELVGSILSTSVEENSAFFSQIPTKP